MSQIVIDGGLAPIFFKNKFSAFPQTCVIPRNFLNGNVAKFENATIPDIRPLFATRPAYDKVIDRSFPQVITTRRKY